MNYASRPCEKYVCYSFDNGVLQHMVFIAKTLSVEETCDLLTWLEKVLEVSKHFHTELLHLNNTSIRKAGLTVA